MKKFLFGKPGNATLHFALFLLRAGFGLLMIPNHGWPKLIGFNEKKSQFMDFIGLGAPISLALVIFAELGCSVLLILGLFTRLALIPLIITTLVIMHTHNWAFFSKHELVSAFMLAYIVLLLLGPGKYSLDNYLFKKL
jgi:putative oxidoreductase